MNKFIESAAIALDAIWSAKLRSFMTVLGNIVAVTSIIAVVSLIQGLNASVKQAILNIVLNGVQAMPEGGTLRITSKREGEHAVIMVRDHGAGIPENIRDKIFNLYFTTKSGGSGIGLAMAYRVVQLHHGAVEFTSILEHGTTFYLRFPLAEVAAGGEQSAAAP